METAAVVSRQRTGSGKSNSAIYGKDAPVDEDKARRNGSRRYERDTRALPLGGIQSPGGAAAPSEAHVHLNQAYAKIGQLASISEATALFNRLLPTFAQVLD
jgi:hypothetical protein